MGAAPGVLVLADIDIEHADRSLAGEFGHSRTPGRTIGAELGSAVTTRPMPRSGFAALIQA
jgi:hypothetical protein